MPLIVQQAAVMMVCVCPLGFEENTRISAAVLLLLLLLHASGPASRAKYLLCLLSMSIWAGSLCWSSAATASPSQGCVGHCHHQRAPSTPYSAQNIFYDYQGSVWDRDRTAIKLRDVHGSWPCMALQKLTGGAQKRGDGVIHRHAPPIALLHTFCRQDRCSHWVRHARDLKASRSACPGSSS